MHSSTYPDSLIGFPNPGNPVLKPIGTPSLFQHKTCGWMSQMAKGVKKDGVKMVGDH